MVNTLPSWTTTSPYPSWTRPLCGSTQGITTSLGTIRTTFPLSMPPPSSLTGPPQEDTCTTLWRHKDSSSMSIKERSCTNSRMSLFSLLEDFLGWTRSCIHSCAIRPSTTAVSSSAARWCMKSTTEQTKRERFATTPS